MCDKSAYRKPEPEPPREPEDIYAEYLKRIEEFRKRMVIEECNSTDKTSK